MPKNPEKAQKAKEKKARKEQEAQMKQSREKADEAKLLMDPVEPKVAPNFAKAIQALDASLALWADNVDALRLRGDCHRETKNYTAAVEDYTTALALDDAHLPSLEGRASCFMTLGKWDVAIADYTRMIQVSPSHDHAYNMRATARLQKRARGLRLRNEELAGVIDDFSKALRLNPNNFHATCNLARCYDEHGMLEDAIAQYTAALKLKDEYTYAVYRRGVAALALVEKRRVERAARNAATGSNAAAAADDDDREVTEEEVRKMIEAERQAEAAAAEEQRLLNSAAEDFTRIVPDEEPEHELPALLHRAACFMLLGQLDKAQADLKIASKFLDPLKTPAELNETVFSGSPAALLKEVLQIRLAEFTAVQQAAKAKQAPAAPVVAA